MPQILVIDDDPGLLNVCRVALDALGYLVRTAETGNEGLTEAAIRTLDVIVLDLGLPDLDGLEVCRRIRTWSDVPIVVLSADGSEDRKVEALDGGADDYMTKPFGMRELDARLRVAVRHRSTADNAEHPAELDVEAFTSTSATTRPPSAAVPSISRRGSSTSWPTWPATSGRSARAG